MFRRKKVFYSLACSEVFMEKMEFVEGNIFSEKLEKAEIIYIKAGEKTCWVGSRCHMLPRYSKGPLTSM